MVFIFLNDDCMKNSKLYFFDLKCYELIKVVIKIKLENESRVVKWIIVSLIYKFSRN